MNKIKVNIKEFVLTIALINSFSFFAHGQQIPELSPIVQESTRSFIKQHLSIKAGDTPFSKDEFNTLISDLSALYELRGTPVRSDLYKNIFLTNNFDGKILVSWIFEKFNKIVPTRGAKCGSTNEIDYQACFVPGERKIRLAPMYFAQGRISRISTLIHEARHSQGYGHIAPGNASEDSIVDGARGAEWSFLAGISTNCANCSLMDKISAFKYSKVISSKMKNLSWSHQKILTEEMASLRDPLEEKYVPLVAQLSREKKRILHSMPSLCLNGLPYNEFTGNPEQASLSDCILVYHLVTSQEIKTHPELSKRSYQKRNGFLIILNPIEKK